MKKFDDLEREMQHTDTDDIVCPYCLTALEDSCLYDATNPCEIDNENLGLIKCINCEKMFYARKIITVQYSTTPATYGTCEHCAASNVPIENKSASWGSYVGLCVDCGFKEERRLIKKSFYETNGAIDE